MKFISILLTVFILSTAISAMPMTGLVVGDSPVVWTDWLDRDDPSGKGDYESLVDFPLGTVPCSNPVAIECAAVLGENIVPMSTYPLTAKPASAVSFIATGENVVCDSAKGGWCINENQSDLICNYDYIVRFACSESSDEVKSEPECNSGGQEQKECSILHGKGSQFRQCNFNNWSNWSDCTVVSCEENYYQVNSQCIAKCTDTDAGKNYFVKGMLDSLDHPDLFDTCRHIYMNTGGSIQSDPVSNCSGNECYIQELYCLYNGNLGYEEFHCDTCSNGACIGTTQANCSNGALEIAECNASNGVGLKKKECVSGAWSNWTTCSQLVCNKGYILSGGKCITAPVLSCKDSDGQNYNVKGIVNFNGTTLSDVCIDDKTLAEMICKEGLPLSTRHSCEYVCNKGACEELIKEPEDTSEINNSKINKTEIRNETDDEENENKSCTNNEMKVYITEKNPVVIKYDGIEYFIESISGNAEKNTLIISVRTGKNITVVKNMYEGDYDIFSSLPVKLSEVFYDSLTNKFSGEICISEEKIGDEEFSARAEKLQEGEMQSGNLVPSNALCDGCLLEGNCFTYGYRSYVGYCGPEKEWLTFTSKNEPCLNNFECSSNICIDSKCLEEGFFRKLAALFKKIM